MPDFAPGSTSELLAALVEIPSVNPLLIDAPGNNELALAAYVAEQLAAGGVDVELQEVRDGRCNVIGHLERRGDADHAVILLSAHMDTYPTKGPRSDYRALVQGRTMYARGSADAKGSLAAMMTAFLAAADAPDRRECYLAATLDEECLLQGAYALAEHGMRPTLAITGEPTRLIPIVGQKGIIRGRFTVTGAGAHAAYPKPDAAIPAVARLVDAVETLNQRLAAAPGGLGPATVSLTRIATDGGMNLVAREASVHFDARFLPGTTGVEFAARMERELRELAPDVAFVLEPMAFVSPANETDLGVPVVEELFSLVKEVAGDCVPETFSYGSEAGVLAWFADAALVFGPGDAGCSHAEVESIDLDELETAHTIFHRLLVGT
jgi:acetylornithine deacetylase/succinyl-diaminopimelate desuccinylase-like protein